MPPAAARSVTLGVHHNQTDAQTQQPAPSPRMCFVTDKQLRSHSSTRQRGGTERKTGSFVLLVKPLLSYSLNNHHRDRGEIHRIASFSVGLILFVLKSKVHFAQHARWELGECPPWEEIGGQIGDVHKHTTTLQSCIEVMVAG